MQKEGNFETVFKIRWFVRLQNGKIKRLQRPVEMKTQITGIEILQIITSYMKKKFGDSCGAPLKIELPSTFFGVQVIHGIDTTISEVSDSVATSASKTGSVVSITIPKPPVASSSSMPKDSTSSFGTQADTMSDLNICYRVVTPDSVFRLPLIFPGPRLANKFCPEFHVTFVVVVIFFPSVIFDFYVVSQLMVQT
jgi:hypothetical protein